MHGKLVEATEHDAADAIVDRAKELEVDIIVLGYQQSPDDPTGSQTQPIRSNTAARPWPPPMHIVSRP